MTPTDQLMVRHNHTTRYVTITRHVDRTAHCRERVFKPGSHITVVYELNTPHLAAPHQSQSICFSYTPNMLIMNMHVNTGTQALFLRSKIRCYILYKRVLVLKSVTKLFFFPVVISPLSTIYCPNMKQNVF